ncbi:Rhodanese-related sulfurtransferase [Schinkia azotoformans MEV2011]|uniref:Rhodanese-related sulfurtransferase n=1 Tax=Schinkia azotoformans MEV2011 TaxID=1348973 RepID=A0A072NGC2_SCHAZ|nr:rhodanese-like domain-containing protein [Schinkia azotoformans]KEF35973.1 Rhodanese-related sulfurtransferase [Schinkia azotoformans MEV2011]MEC1694536.1 rhodanese-like domain-containing protein [Schinkia azotoformans]MEC1716530.1 rhodanese-like domain-containing protein [Schinkia azotoformans]MEC1725242.1 rhodanese-like domain-containing protein [Schinkia azotoformans]MEC1739368.1 rhodanese-like domain-containing protein [Schinkia azotoformans]
MKQISAKEVETLINEGKKIDIIDVREDFEVATGKIPGAVHIPIGSIEFRMDELDKSKEYIIVCHSGARSGAVTRFLEGHGFNATNMSGGVVEWEGEIE